uniref:Protein kinase domain-containing protein n=1 Tax=Maylandia zebra TaxID=106582 RepID=A0A3P9BWW2_9CICH
MLALDLELVKGSILGKHYKVEAFLGEGGFGIVAKCRDTTTNQAVAIKVNKTEARGSCSDAPVSSAGSQLRLSDRAPGREAGGTPPPKWPERAPGSRPR